jgi:uncharacterized protein YkwD
MSAHARFASVAKPLIARPRKHLVSFRNGMTLHPQSIKQFSQVNPAITPQIVASGQRIAQIWSRGRAMFAFRLFYSNSVTDLGIMVMSGLVRLGALALLLAASTPAFAGCSKPGNQGEIASQVAQMTNQFRRSMGLSQVKVSSALNKAAQAYACEMASNGNFSHVGANGSNVKTRATKAGYGKACMLAENIAWGYEGTEVVMNGWENSSKHRANLSHRKAKEIGIGLAYNGDTPYWVMMLGSKC